MKHYAIILTSAMLVGATTAPDTISGTVVHSRSNVPASSPNVPISGATVTLKTTDTTITATTDSVGKFTLVRDMVGIKSSTVQKQLTPFKIENNRITFGSSDISKVTLADIRGRILFSKEITAGQKFVDLPNDASGYRLISMMSRSGGTQTVPWISGSPMSRSEVRPMASVRVAGGDPVEIVDPFPDTMSITAEGYPELMVAVNIDQNKMVDTISMIDSSRGSAKQIEIINEAVESDNHKQTISDTLLGEGYYQVLHNIHPVYPFGQSEYSYWHYEVERTMTARATGFYTKVLFPQGSGTNLPDGIDGWAASSYKSAFYFTDVDLDSIENYTTSISGTIMLYENDVQIFPGNPYETNTTICYPPTGELAYRIVLYKADSVTAIDTTNVMECGRYQFENVPEGSYVVKIAGWEHETGGTLAVNTAETRTLDFCGIFYAQTLAPNIYLYPETTSKIDVSVNIRENGSIPFSIPTYGNGWSVTATPEGKINDSLGFLYYDFISPVTYQSDSGWVLSFPNFDKEVTALLSARGLNKQEIYDFIDFWKKYIPACDWVTLYPTDANRMVELTVNPKPTTLFRELYLVKPTSGTKPVVKEPSKGKPFERKGFTVVEWGGHLDGLDLNKVIADKQKK